MKKKFRNVFSGFSIKIIILLIVFLAVIGLYFIFNKDETTVNTSKMGDASLPVVYMTYEGARLNEIHGNTETMDETAMRDTITPLTDSYEINMEIDTYGSQVKEISYEIVSLDGSNLVQSNKIKDWNEAEETIKATISVDEMVAHNTEYMLVINVVTDSQAAVNYYTRILNEDDSYVSRQINFVHQFSDLTLDKARSEELINYLEPDTQENDNSNFGLVTMHSNYHQVSWGSMAPEQVTEPVLSIKEMFGSIGCFQLKYVVRSGDQYYSVVEYFRVNIGNDKAYLLDYERRADEIFYPSSVNVSKKEINLGINSDLITEYTSDDGGVYVGFVNSGTLWSMNTDTNTIIPVFSFRGEDQSSIRENFDQYDIKIIRVEDSGNICFMVYGYMNRGPHEGLTGIAVYNYYAESNTIEEKTFIASDRPYQMIKNLMGKLTYLNGNNLLYILLNDSLYSIDLTGEEYVQVAIGLTEGNYAVSYDGSKIAWHADGSVNNSKEIQVLDLETAQTQTVYAPENSYIRALGFLGEGFVYGIGSMGDFVPQTNGAGTLYLNELKVVDASGNETLTKKDDGTYYTWSENEYNRISLGRAVKTGDAFTPSSDYAIYDTTRAEEKKTEVSVLADSVRKNELVMSFKTAVIKAGDVNVAAAGEFAFRNPAGLKLEDLVNISDRYIVYGKGELKGVYTNPSNAVNAADAQLGVVTSSGQQYFWIRGIAKKSADVSNINTQNVLEALNDNSGKGILSLKGCTLNQMLYFVSTGHIITARTGEGVYIISGYDAYNVRIIQVESGATSEMPIAGADAYFAASGNDYTLIKQ